MLLKSACFHLISKKGNLSQQRWLKKFKKKCIPCRWFCFIFTPEANRTRIRLEPDGDHLKKCVLAWLFGPYQGYLEFIHLLKRSRPTDENEEQKRSRSVGLLPTNPRQKGLNIHVVDCFILHVFISLFRNHFPL